MTEVVIISEVVIIIIGGRCSANKWTGFYMITASVMKELIIEITRENAFFIFVEIAEASLYDLAKKQMH